VPGLSGVVQIAAGNASTCALDQSGVVTCWGHDQVGLLEVEGIGGATAIAMGWGHACALTTAGGLRCWGYNNFGQLGDGTVIYSPDDPVDVVGLTSGVASVYAGGNATCAITDEGVAKCWGDNALGQLGNGEIGYATIPQDVVGSPFGERIFADGFD
jgi:alpha-tubulin suppressor-like RCC1 family protein